MVSFNDLGRRHKRALLINSAMLNDAIAMLAHAAEKDMHNISDTLYVGATNGVDSLSEEQIDEMIDCIDAAIEGERHSVGLRLPVSGVALAASGQVPYWQDEKTGKLAEEVYEFLDSLDRSQPIGASGHLKCYLMIWANWPTWSLPPEGLEVLQAATRLLEDATTAADYDRVLEMMLSVGVDPL